MMDKKEMYRLHLGTSSCSENDSEAEIELDEFHKSNKPPALNYEDIQDKIVRVNAEPVPVFNVWNQHNEAGTILTSLTSDPKELGTKKKKKKKAAKTITIVQPVKEEPEPLKFDICDAKSLTGSTSDPKTSGTKKKKKKKTAETITIVQPVKKEPEPWKFDIYDAKSLTSLTSDPKASGTKKKKKKKTAETETVKIDKPVQKEPEPLKFDIYDDESFPPLTVKRDFAFDPNIFPSSISTQNILLKDNEMFSDQLSMPSHYVTEASIHINEYAVTKNGKIGKKSKKRVSKAYDEFLKNPTWCDPYSLDKLSCQNIVNANQVRIQMQEDNNGKVAQILYGNCEGRTVNSYYFMQNNSHISQLSVLRTEWASEPNEFDAFKTYYYKDNEFDTVGITALSTNKRILWGNETKIEDYDIDKLDNSYERFLELPYNYVDIDPNQNELTPIQTPTKKKKKKKSNNVFPTLIDCQRKLIGDGSEERIKDFTVPTMQSKLLKALESPNDGSKKQIQIHDTFICKGNQEKENTTTTSPKNTSMNQNINKTLAELISNLLKDTSLVTHYYCYQGEQFPTFRKYREHYLFKDVRTLMRVKDQPVNTVENDISMYSDNVNSSITKNDYTEPKHCSDHTLKIISNCDSNIKIIHEKRNYGDSGLISNGKYIEIVIPPTLNVINIDSNYIKSRIKNCYYSIEALEKVLKLSNLDQTQIKETIIKVKRSKRKKNKTKIKKTISKNSPTLISQQKDIKSETYPSTSKNSLTVLANRTDLDRDEKSETIKNLSIDPSVVSHYYLYQGENFKKFCKFRDVYLFKNLENVDKTVNETVDKGSSFIYSPEVEKHKCDSKCSICSLGQKCVHVMTLFLTFYLIVNFVHCIYIFLFNNFYYFLLLYVMIKQIKF